MAPHYQYLINFSKLPRLGSNQESSAPEADVLPITPQGTAIGRVKLKARLPGRNRASRAGPGDPSPRGFVPRRARHTYGGYAARAASGWTEAPAGNPVNVPCTPSTAAGHKCPSRTSRSSIPKTSGTGIPDR